MFGAVAFGLLALFWASAELHARGVAVPLVRPVAGLVLLLFVPGVLFSRLVGIRTERFGAFVVFAVALSFGVVTMLNLFVGIVLAPLGFEEPLSFLPLALGLSVVVVGLVVATLLTRTAVSVPRIRLAGSVPVILLLLVLPTLSVAAVFGLDQFGTNAGMFLFLAATLLVTLLAATRYVPPALYPLTVFSVSISVLFHRNLLTDHVVGADIQATYFLSNLLLRTNHWAPDMGGSLMSLPAVTSVPATITMLAGIELATTFKIVYVFLFSLVPLGLFYVNARVFDERIALFGSLFFLFYHGTFYFTPGKQLVSELFVVAILLLFVYQGVNSIGRTLALVVLALTVISSHYGMAYALGGSLVVAYLGLEALKRFVGDFDHVLSLWYPVGSLALATAFYAYSAPDLVARLGSLPLTIADQFVTLALTGGVPGSGASYVEGRTGFLVSLRLYLYLLLTGLVGLGLTRDVLGRLARLRHGRDSEYAEYAALAVPFFVFLGSSYFIIPNLWADRVYQMVLTVLAPYVAVGYVTVFDGVGAVLRRTGVAPRVTEVRDRLAGGVWALLPVLLAALLALNSGMAFALAGSPDTASFDPEANDLTFTDPERSATSWLDANAAAIERYDRLRSPDDSSSRDTVSVYTEPSSYQLLRSVALPGYTNVELLRMKSRWRPTVYPETIEGGYVLVRDRSVDSAASDEELSSSTLSEDEVESVSATRNRIYSSEAALISYSDNGSEA